MQRVLYRVIRIAFIFGWLLLVASGNARANEQKILVLGDSISAAYGMSLEQGWVALMATALAERNPQTSIVNASISGETSAGGLRRLPALLQQHDPGLLIIELGANDGLRGYPLQSLRDNLVKMATLAQQAGAAVILLPMEIPPNYGPRYASGFREAFREVAEETGSVLGPFLLDGVATDPKLIQSDGLHPTVEAQPLIMGNVLPTVVRVLDAS